MLKYFLCIPLIILLNVWATVRAQPYHDNIWLQSDREDGSLIDFSSGSPVVSDLDTDLDMAGASASICNAAGDLMFYTNGCRIYNWQHRLMENGEGINDGEIYDEFCNLNDPLPRGYPMAPQSTAAIPWPNHPDQYILLHIYTSRNFDSSIPFYGIPSRIYTTTVNMALNNGEGQVVNKNIVLDTLFVEPKMALNRHANGNDWWMINPVLSSNDYNIYFIDSTGAHFNRRQSIGLIDDFFDVAADQLVFTPMGDQLLRYGADQGLRIFDFDRSTGELSNFQHIPFPQGAVPDLLQFGGVAVSPSGQFAYVGNQIAIYQFDLWAEDIESSGVLIAELVDNGEMFLRPTVHMLQLGPDCKIYAYMVNGDRHHIIHAPDERGAACEWEQGGLRLGHYVFRDQPTFPNFRLGPLGDEGSPCSEPIVSITDERETPGVEASVFPNPAEREVAFSVADAGVERVVLTDILGRTVLEKQANLRTGDAGYLSLRGVAGGTYLLRLQLDDGRVAVRKLSVR